MMEKFAELIIEDYSFDNSGQGKLRVPGSNGIPYYTQLHGRVTFAGRYWCQKPNITARELRLLRTIAEITDEDDWFINVYDEACVATWYQKFKNVDLMNERTWNWCLEELRDKASQYKETKIIQTFDTGASICRADGVIPLEFQDLFRQTLDPLFEEAEDGYDTGMVFIVDPFDHPLIFGPTKVLLDGGTVELRRPTHSSGTPQIVPRQHHIGLAQFAKHSVINKSLRTKLTRSVIANLDHHVASAKYQWLPCDIEFTNMEDRPLRITSYINNLHPDQESLYRAIEKLVYAAIEPWNRVLHKSTDNQGRYPLRIRTWGVERYPIRPPIDDTKSYCKRVDVLEKVLPPDCSDPNNFLSQRPWSEYQPWYSHVYKHPDLGTTFSYSEWKQGHTAKAIVPRVQCSETDTPFVVEDCDHEYYEISLADDFRETGLQVVVEIGGIELDEEIPFWKAPDDWKAEGLLNEHIVAVALYPYSISNIDPPRISFEVRTDNDVEGFYAHPGDDLDELMSIFDLGDEDEKRTYPQKLGCVCLKEGQLLCWPNSLLYREESFGLVDSTQPGHLRYIKLMLVDPNYRICSTRNVPAQQPHWIARDAMEVADLHTRLPQEIVDIVSDQLLAGLVDEEKVQRTRDRMVKEREDADYELHWAPQRGIRQHCRKPEDR